MTDPSFDAPGYWDRRLGDHFDLRGVGYLRYSRGYNECLYRRKGEVLAGAMRRHGIRVGESRLLDLGSGTGYWLRWFKARGGENLTGLDVSESAVARLSKELPETRVYRADLTQRWPVEGPFDLISAFDVLYHVVDDEGFEGALEEATRVLAPGGFLVLTDRLGGELSRDGAAHVRFRTLQHYRSILAPRGVTVEATYPLFYLLNGGLANLRWVRHRPRLRWLVVRLENLLAPLLLRLDRALVAPGRANLRLLVARASKEI